MSRPQILAFHLTEERLRQLRLCCMRLSLSVTPVPEEDVAQPLGVLCGLEERKPLGPVAGGPLKEEMLLFCLMSDAQVNAVLSAIRRARLKPFALKAVLTPTNVAWNALRLQQELSAEREAIARAGVPVHAGPTNASSD